MKDKWMYMLMGFMGGIILILVLGKIPVQPALALPESTKMDSGSADGMIALTTNTTNLKETILWVLDTKNKKLLTYEYDGNRNIKFRAFRDIKYDLNITDGSAGKIEPKEADWSPMDIKQWFETLTKIKEEANKKR